MNKRFLQIWEPYCFACIWSWIWIFKMSLISKKMVTFDSHFLGYILKEMAAVLVLTLHSFFFRAVLPFYSTNFIKLKYTKYLTELDKDLIICPNCVGSLVKIHGKYFTWWDILVMVCGNFVSCFSVFLLVCLAFLLLWQQSILWINNNTFALCPLLENHDSLSVKNSKSKGQR